MIGWLVRIGFIEMIDWWDGLEKDQLETPIRSGCGGASNQPSCLTCIAFVLVPLVALVIMYLLW